jgi:hypothetical protein
MSKIGLFLEKGKNRVFRRSRTPGKKTPFFDFIGKGAFLVLKPVFPLENGIFRPFFDDLVQNQ